MPERIVFPKKGVVELQPCDLPDAGDGALQLETLYSLMSIGTETTILHQKYAAGTHFDRIFSFPQLKTGVQAVARVAETGSGVEEFVVGDHVYVRLAHGSHQVVPAADCSPIPAGVDLKQACWAGLAKTAFRAAWAGRFQPGGSVLIVGCGPVGQMLLRWARASELEKIVVVDVAEQRLDHARTGGATHLVHGELIEQANRIAAMWDSDGPPLIVDTTGNPAVFADALATAGKFGKLVLLGDTGYPGRQCLTSDVMTKGLTVVATHDSHDRDDWTQRRIDEHFFAQLAAGRFSLDGLITHEFSPRQCVDAYELASNRRAQAMGILFDWTPFH